MSLKQARVKGTETPFLLKDMSEENKGGFMSNREQPIPYVKIKILI